MNTYNKQFDFSLLIPCYNDFEGLILSIKSIDYYPERFLIVIVDDGSRTPVSIDSIKEKDQVNCEIVVLKNDENKGITDALNKGLKWIRENTDSKFIARLDCGDVCRSDRFFKQMDYMNTNPETGLLGSWCVFENKEGSKRYYYKTPVDQKKIMRAMHLKNVFIHPTVMFRTDLLTTVGYYPENYAYAEDYAFFWGMVKMKPSHILNEFLVVCEINEQGISLQNRQKQLKSRLKIMTKYSTSPFLKFIGKLRIQILRLLPQALVLPLKSSIKKQ